MEPNFETMECDGTVNVVHNSNLDALMRQLRQGAVHMFYRKKDGTLREAYGTLSDNFIPHRYWPAGKREAREYLVNYWDLQKGGWRAFQKSRFEYFIEPGQEQLTH
jgi:hypothetical protein